ncbi:peptidoglycan-associated lipoprotein Pal [uncultured Desulfuromusa sp.]|uniref:peptidoglycan-associated lipoprotein Pal n=1 Tax=uncultured Desulfuromusa sp. TaxID=219183 RepID=UPI002AA7E345|nr:peptidoglycan-associated lipoprotein Pal [uncultured Desulfuromusa sp.]
MSKSTITRLVVMLFALTLLASGCAKKPVAEEPAVMEQPAVEMQQEQPAVVVEEQVTEAAPAYDAAAVARAAEVAAAKGLERIHFDFDQYVLTDAAKAILVSNAGLLRAAPMVNVLIEGHCDERGSDEYNLALGEKRALATKNYLVSLGVAAERMNVISYGEEMPIDPARTIEAWAKNRRAAFKVKN